MHRASARAISLLVTRAVRRRLNRDVKIVELSSQATAQRKVARSGGSLGEIQTWHFLTGQPRSLGANP